MLKTKKYMLGIIVLGLTGIAQAQTSSGATAPDATSASSSSTSSDPFVERREAKKEAKREYKAEKKDAKQEYKQAKKEANAKLKSSGDRSTTEKNLDVPGTSKSSGQ